MFQQKSQPRCRVLPSLVQEIGKEVDNPYGQPVTRLCSKAILHSLTWQETISGHGGSFHPNIWIIFANYLRSDVEYRRKQSSKAEVIFRLDAYIRWLGGYLHLFMWLFTAMFWLLFDYWFSLLENSVQGWAALTVNVNESLLVKIWRQLLIFSDFRWSLFCLYMLAKTSCGTCQSMSMVPSILFLRSIWVIQIHCHTNVRDVAHFCDDNNFNLFKRRLWFCDVR